MKSFVGLVLFVFVVVSADPPAKSGYQQGQCPPAPPTIGICVFNPDVNCVQDSECKDGQVCCSSGCNKVCKDPVKEDVAQPSPPPPSTTIKQCPPKSSSDMAGICVFDEKVNCLDDDQCKNGQLCCAEGCNKVCKDPVTFQQMKPYSNGESNPNSMKQMRTY